MVALAARTLGRQDHVDDEEFQAIFNESALKLRGNQAPESEAPWDVRDFGREVPVSGHL